MTSSNQKRHIASWLVALCDHRLRIYILVNIIFTIYVSQLHSTLPIYFKNFVPVGNSIKGFAETTISALFAWHLAVAILFWAAGFILCSISSSAVGNFGIRTICPCYYLLHPLSLFFSHRPSPRIATWHLFLLRVPSAGQLAISLVLH